MAVVRNHDTYIFTSWSNVERCTAGSGVYGWETEEEEDIWEVGLDQICLEAEEYEHGALDPEMTIGELMEWRYLRAELEKEQVIIFNLAATITLTITLICSFTLFLCLGKYCFQARQV